ncbi:type II toxin-antitoxin system RelE/ParE family toxin [Sphingomonas sp. ZT3P38]|uniref:type II toxin-antitoxin system RelE/ParE family toxin n=1 Tax=Parasphingomonas zepuensis TaxID=3096161 RepID=UPI002FCAC0F6
MSYQVRLGARAYEDLADIWMWIATEADLDTADAYGSRLRRHLAKLVDFPRRGSPRNDLRHGLRSLVFERHMTIFYEIEGQVVTILRIVHGARDQTALFGA